jgi:glycosyltransferase involved in cell wall biosynthesis
VSAVPTVAVVIPVFNREWCVTRALDSASRFLRGMGGGEIVIVDDGSTDGSAREVEAFLRSSGAEGVSAKLHRMPRNRGVCAAKNSGARGASADWILFLDSDDELIESSAPALASTLAAHANAPLHFFRCVDETGAQIGQVLTGSIRRGLNDFIVIGTSGESLPVVSREMFLRFPYDEDIQGFEGLSYSRIVRESGAAWIHPLVVRRYYTSHDDRLSSTAGVRRRARSLAKGYRRLLGEHFGKLSFRSRRFIFTRALYHQLRSVLR